MAMLGLEGQKQQDSKDDEMAKRRALFQNIKQGLADDQ